MHVHAHIVHAHVHVHAHAHMSTVSMGMCTRMPGMHLPVMAWACQP